MSRIVVTDDARAGESLSSLYGLNTLGAGVGALVAIGFATASLCAAAAPKW